MQSNNNMSHLQYDREGVTKLSSRKILVMVHYQQILNIKELG